MFQVGRAYEKEKDGDRNGEREEREAGIWKMDKRVKATALLG